MISAQNRILSLIEKILDERGVQHSISHSYGNSGNVYFYKSPADAVAFGSIRFDFQSSYYTVSIKLNGCDILSQPPRPGYFDFLQDFDKPTRFWDALAEALDKAGFPVKKVSAKKPTVVKEAKSNPQ